MTPLDIMKQPVAYANGYEKMLFEAQNHVKQLCWEYNYTAPNEQEKRHSILQELLGTCPPMAGIEPVFIVIMVLISICMDLLFLIIIASFWTLHR